MVLVLNGVFDEIEEVKAFGGIMMKDGDFVNEQTGRRTRDVRPDFKSEDPLTASDMMPL